MRRTFGEDNIFTLELRGMYGEWVLEDPRRATRGDIDEAVTILKDVVLRSTRVFGAVHPSTRKSQEVLTLLKAARARLA